MTMSRAVHTCAGAALRAHLTTARRFGDRGGEAGAAESAGGVPRPATGCSRTMSWRRRLFGHAAPDGTAAPVCEVP